MKTYIVSCITGDGSAHEVEVEANSKKDANWHARRALYVLGHRGRLHCKAMEKPKGET